MPASEAQKRAVKKWEENNIDRVNLKLSKTNPPTKNQVEEAAAAAGQSLNSYIVQAIRERMEAATRPNMNAQARIKEPEYKDTPAVGQAPQIATHEPQTKAEDWAAPKQTQTQAEASFEDKRQRMIDLLNRMK